MAILKIAWTQVVFWTVRPTSFDWYIHNHILFFLTHITYIKYIKGVLFLQFTRAILSGRICDFNFWDSCADWRFSGSSQSLLGQVVNVKMIIFPFTVYAYYIDLSHASVTWLLTKRKWKKNDFTILFLKGTLHFRNNIGLKDSLDPPE